MPYGKLEGTCDSTRSSPLLINAGKLAGEADITRSIPLFITFGMNEQVISVDPGPFS